MKKADKKQMKRVMRLLTDQDYTPCITINIDVNGIGYPLYDMLKKELEPYGITINKCHPTAKRK